MDRDRRDETEGQQRGGGRDGERRGPPESTFLDLEISKVLAGEAEALSRDAVREILKEAIKARLQERLGDRLERLARIAADELADDVEANLEIEGRIAARREARRSIEARFEEALRAPPGGAVARAKRRR